MEKNPQAVSLLVGDLALSKPKPGIKPAAVADVFLSEFISATTSGNAVITDGYFSSSDEFGS